MQGKKCCGAFDSTSATLGSTGIIGGTIGSTADYSAGRLIGAKTLTPAIPTIEDGVNLSLNKAYALEFRVQSILDRLQGSAKVGSDDKTLPSAITITDKVYTTRQVLSRIEDRLGDISRILFDSEKEG